MHALISSHVQLFQIYQYATLQLRRTRKIRCNWASRYISFTYFSIIMDSGLQYGCLALFVCTLVLNGGTRHIYGQILHTDNCFCLSAVPVMSDTIQNVHFEAGTEKQTKM